jgi:hypothetical protein
MDNAMKSITPDLDKFNYGGALFGSFFGRANYEQDLCLKPDYGF